MALRGSGAGGYSFFLPDEYDDAADLSAFLWIRRGSDVTGGSRIFNLINSARTRGFIVHVGGSASGTTLPTEVVISVSSTNDATWGAGSNQDGRGRATLADFSGADFCPLAFSIRGSAALDNTGSGGAQQLHEVWWKGAPAAVETGSVGSGVPKPGGRMTLLCREAPNLSAFDGWVAEVAVWQNYRLSAADAARLARGISPLAIAPELLLLYRSFRTGVEAEVGNTSFMPLGTGVTVEMATHPPLLIEGSGGRLGAENGAPTLAAHAAPMLAVNAGWHRQDATSAGLAACAAPVLHAAGGRHFMTAGQVVFTAAGQLVPQAGQHAQTAGAPSLLWLAAAAETMRVPPERRGMTAGWP